MTDYQITHHWELVNGIGTIFVTVSGRLLTHPHALAEVIDQIHLLADHQEVYDRVHVICDFTRTEGRLPIQSLMLCGAYSKKVNTVSVVGARSRADEMSVLIMGAALNRPYSFNFFPSIQAARAHFKMKAVSDLASMNC